MRQHPEVSAQIVDSNTGKEPPAQGTRIVYNTPQADLRNLCPVGICRTRQPTNLPCAWGADPGCIFTNICSLYKQLQKGSVERRSSELLLVRRAETRQTHGLWAGHLLLCNGITTNLVA